MFTYKLIIIGFKDIHTFKFICEIYRNGFSLTSIDNLTESMRLFQLCFLNKKCLKSLLTPQGKHVVSNLLIYFLVAHLSIKDVYLQ